jgi:hypothetical protein
VLSTELGHYLESASRQIVQSGLLARGQKFPTFLLYIGKKTVLGSVQSREPIHWKPRKSQKLGSRRPGKEYQKDGLWGPTEQCGRLSNLLYVSHLEKNLYTCQYLSIAMVLVPFIKASVWSQILTTRPIALEGVRPTALGFVRIKEITHSGIVLLK